jgi:glycosyltransferase involved in cell wall biosynthesis
MVRPRSITAFFPAYNDGGTIPSMVLTALMTLRRVTGDYEVIVVNDGSADYTAEVLDELASRYPELRVIHHPKNRGYVPPLCQAGLWLQAAGRGLRLSPHPPRHL